MLGNDSVVEQLTASEGLSYMELLNQLSRIFSPNLPEIKAYWT
jgi:uncharacterized protein YidB (DUF937 family)